MPSEGKDSSDDADAPPPPLEGKYADADELVVQSTNVVESPGGTQTIDVNLAAVPPSRGEKGDGPAAAKKPGPPAKPKRRSSDVKSKPSASAAKSGDAKAKPAAPKRRGSQGGAKRAAPSARASAAAAADAEEQERVRQWKAQMAAEEAEEAALTNDFLNQLERETEQSRTAMGLDGDGDESDDEDDDMEAREIRKRFGVESKDDEGKVAGKSAAPVMDPFAGGDFNAERAANEQLLRALDTKDRQIELLHAKLLASGAGADAVDAIDPDVLEMGGPQPDVRDAKIIELSKKQRTTQMALSRERAKCAKLTADLRKANELTAKRAARIAKLGGGEGDADDAPASAAPERDSKDALRAAQHKVEVLRRQLDRSQCDHKRMKRALVKEVGEGPHLERLLGALSAGSSAAALHNEDQRNPLGRGAGNRNHPGTRAGGGKAEAMDGWRGRAQQIAMLRTKLKRVSTELEDARRAANPNSATAKYQSAASRRDVDHKAVEDVRAMERERRVAMERVVSEYNELEDAYDGLARRHEGAKARNKVLEEEGRKAKQQIKVLLGKTSNDDALVDALRAEVARYKRTAASLQQHTESIQSGTVPEAAYATLQSHCDGQAAQIERQEQLILGLRAEIKQLQESASRGIVERAEEELETQTNTVNSKLLQVENERQSELVALFKTKFEQAEAEAKEAHRRAKELERSVVELERRLGNINVGGRKRQPPADQFQSLKDKLALQVEENEALKESARQSLATKDQEIAIMREMANEVKATYEQAINRMKCQVKQTAGQAQARVIQSEVSTDAAMLSQLAQDNEFLRSEQVYAGRQS